MDTGVLAARLATNVRRTRRARGLTQADLAERAAMSVRQLADIERALTNSTLAMVEQLAHGLRVDPLALLAPAPKPVRRGPGRPNADDD